MTKLIALLLSQSPPQHLHNGIHGGQYGRWNKRDGRPAASIDVTHSTVIVDAKELAKTATNCTTHIMCSHSQLL